MVKLIGNDSDDTFDLSGSYDEITADAGAGFDVVRLTGDTSISRFILAAASGVEKLDLKYFALRGTDGGDVFDLRGISSFTMAHLDEQWNGWPDPISLGMGNDAFTGHSGSDFIEGGAGDDLLNGGDGDDWFYLSYNPGSDTFNGGDGNDRLIIYGNVSVNGLNLGAASSVEALWIAPGSLSGTEGDNNFDLSGVTYAKYYDGEVDSTSVIELRGGNDRFDGSAIDDHANGGNGDDLLYGNEGNDTLRGGAGADNLYGGDGNDTLYGDAGNNAFDGGNDVIDGGNGNDMLEAGDGTDTIKGGAGDDVLKGGDDDDVLEGESGNDTLVGGRGNDTLKGGDGDDTFVISRLSGNDTFYGGAGRDSLSLGGNATLASIDGSTLSSIEEIHFNGHTLKGTKSADKFDLRFFDKVVGLSRVSLGDGNDKYIGSNGDDRVDGGTGDDNLSSGAGRDKLIGGRGKDKLNGGSAEDELFGGTSNDLLNGGSGKDFLHGGSGNDTYTIDNKGDQVFEGAKEGTDIVMASVSLALSENVERLTLTGKGNLNGTGNASHNVVTGNSGRNLLDGGKGNDVLKGGAGNDKLIGGRGADDLYGGSGNDTFVFKSYLDSSTGKSGRDNIFDFSQKQGDKIDLSAIDAKYTTIRNEAFTFIGAAKFSQDKAGELRYEKKNGDTFAYGDVDADGKADFSIHLDGLTTLRSGDFIL